MVHVSFHIQVWWTGGSRTFVSKFMEFKQNIELKLILNENENPIPGAHLRSTYLSIGNDVLNCLRRKNMKRSELSISNIPLLLPQNFQPFPSLFVWKYKSKSYSDLHSTISCDNDIYSNIAYVYNCTCMSLCKLTEENLTLRQIYSSDRKIYFYLYKYIPRM